jgi:hypothetical protein
MSSTLFARGINSQVGMKRRTDEMNKNIAGLKSDITLIKQTSDEITSIRSMMDSMNLKIVALEKKIDTFIAATNALHAGTTPSITVTETA